VATSAGIDRTSGIALWRQIADDIRTAIQDGEFAEMRKLPGEMTLADRFGVNRHTVRAAIAALQGEGILRPMPGRGTEIISIGKLSLPISRRTRFSTGLGGQSRRPEMSFVSSSMAPAPRDAAEALQIPEGEPCVVLETLGLADGVPVSLARHHFPTSRFAGIDQHFMRERSITKAFAALGVADYLRKSTEIGARLADEVERGWLKLSAGAVVLEAIAINTDLDGVAVQFSKTRFAASRVSLHVAEGLEANAQG
jgi:GntR family transcriptional regulator, phosphonate transport system regulatory protein